MAYSTRHFIVSDGNKLKKLPQTVYYRLCTGQASLPQHAGTTITVASCTVETKDRRVIGAMLFHGDRFKILKDGSGCEENIRLRNSAIGEKIAKASPVIYGGPGKVTQLAGLYFFNIPDGGDLLQAMARELNLM